VKPVHFSDPAAAELAASTQWYEQRRAGRHFAVHRFPYRIVYRVRDEDIYIVAIAHSSRRPDYWRDRP